MVTEMQSMMTPWVTDQTTYAPTSALTSVMRARVNGSLATRECRGVDEGEIGPTSLQSTAVSTADTGTPTDRSFLPGRKGLDRGGGDGAESSRICHSGHGAQVVDRVEIAGRRQQLDGATELT